MRHGKKMGNKRFPPSALCLQVVSMSTVTYAQQGKCGDPFKDVGRLRFSTAYWQKTDFCKHSVPYDEIFSGGPPPNGIPPIDRPHFETVAAAERWLSAQSPVIALQIGEDVRAYPLAILIWHEIVNDTVGGVPVAVTFCPLCNSALVFDRRVDGHVLRFGVSGNLRKSDLVMWDEQTQSWWQQITGEVIVGALTGARLALIGSQVVSFEAFKRAFPHGKVLSRETGHDRSYGRNPYTSYDSNPRPFLFEGEIDPRLSATEPVLAGIVDGVAIAYPFSALRREITLNDTIESVPVVAFWQDGAVSALDRSDIDSSRRVGMAALYKRQLDGQMLTFERSKDGSLRDLETGSTWDIFGRALEGSLAGAQLVRLPANLHFWFAWAAFQPKTRLCGQ
ncbi:MAG: hypothetical protein CUN51_05505 [Candidatus Thermofonsia Clade 1 bacterium]|uniref:DUF3179 domain-containing protein n=1 Tax=Candidatus Thermofonsia Clade 1 bacterium TaxID=2364210 RepID=A0A2M8P071_9CHLR|nr:MAG: hypothetical protein CUN51_05505 [Candidatus Thermofonsia Clade 1 bacterium]